MTNLPSNFVTHNNPLYPLEVTDRFWAKVDIKSRSDCWLWRASRNSDGYGRIKVSGRVVRANRLSWEIYNNRFLGKNEALHHCDNPPCCNPNHIYAGDCSRNKQDMIDRMRTLKGSDNPNSKLNDNDIVQIRMMIAMGLPNTQIGMYMNVTHQMIWYIRRGLSWARQ